MLNVVMNCKGDAVKEVLSLNEIGVLVCNER